MENDIKTAISLLRNGQPPGNSEILDEITVGFDFMADFWKEKYLNEFITRGGSKIKFLTGRSGSGKTHFLQYFTAHARSLGYIVADFSAKDVWMHDFKDVYSEIFKKVDLMECLRKCSLRIVEAMGYDPAEMSRDEYFVDFLANRDALDPFIKKDIRASLQDMFLKNPLLDNNFGIACGLLTGGILGSPILEAGNRDILLSWISGSGDVKLPTLRSLGLSPSKITKYNARHMLRSLSEIVRMAGYPGILVAIDDLDIFISSNSLDVIRYTRLKREDAYESIRELIDDVDTLRNIMFIFSFDKKLIDDETYGLKSYQALWMRIQNEIVNDRFNKFTDIVDLDKLMEQFFTADTVLDMSAKLSGLLNRADNDTIPIDRHMADDIIARSSMGKISIPKRVALATVNIGGAEDV